MAQRADIRNDLLRPNHLPAVAVPDLQITGWAGMGVCGGYHPVVDKQDGMCNCLFVTSSNTSPAIESTAAE